MASNNETISNLISSAINANEPVDLLLISKSLDSINGEVVGTDPDYGMHFNYLYIGMSGQRMVDQMNSNFHAIDAQFLSNNDNFNIRIISNQIKEIKVEDGIVYYTVDNTTWVPLQAEWGKIAGTLANQTDLMTILNDKIGTDRFNALSASVGVNTNNILLLQNDVTSITNSVTSISNQINGNDGILIRLSNAETLLAKKITSNQVLEIRTINGTSLEFTTDGTNWHPVSSAGQVEWGDVIGDIANQADLQLLFKNANDAIALVQTNLTTHTSNVSNPHNVTKAQIGLGNVDNTADVDKPLSTSQKEYIDSSVGAIKFQSLTKAQYEALTTKDNTTMYFINDL